MLQLIAETELLTRNNPLAEMPVLIGELQCYTAAAGSGSSTLLH